MKVFYSVIFYTGERITLKDNNLVYNPGSSQKSSLISIIETSKEAIKETSKELVNYNIIIKMFQWFLIAHEFLFTTNVHIFFILCEI